MKHYTDEFDSGITMDAHGKKLRKDDPLLAVIGDIDEFNSLLGVVRTTVDTKINELLKEIQDDCMLLSSDLMGTGTLVPSRVSRLEELLEQYEQALPPLTHFILPSGPQPAALLQLARSLSRRVERELVTLKEHQNVSLIVLKYINRLSDLLFMLARRETQASGGKEEAWEPRL